MKITLAIIVCALAFVTTPAHADTPGCQNSVDINNAGRNWFMLQFGGNFGCQVFLGASVGDTCEPGRDVYYLCHAPGDLFEYKLDTGAWFCNTSPYLIEGDRIWYRVYGSAGTWVRFNHETMHCWCGTPSAPTGASCEWQ